MARPTGFEPAISSVTGRRDRPTSLRAHIADNLRIIADFADHINRGDPFNFQRAGGIIAKIDQCRCSSAGRAALS